MSSPSFIALIGDLVASRQIDVVERRSIQERLGAHFATVGSAAIGGVATEPLITLGDEFQALFTADPQGAQAIMTQITALVELAHPAAVRFGLGVGELSTALQPRALGMDGPCFHRARQALDRARNLDLSCQIISGAETLDALWSGLASYALRERIGWTDPQREAIRLYEQLGAWNKVADALQVTGGAVSLRQRAAGWPLYRHAWSALESGLVKIVTQEGDPS
jgi:hypothetical protein